MLVTASCIITDVINLTSTTTATLVAVVDPETRISFLFARCRYMSNLSILLVIN